MIKLRSLLIEDSNYMLEYINDEDISKNFKFTRYPFSREGFIAFIEKSWLDSINIHFAIEADEYAGTVSLKNINIIDRTAEYAIVVRKKYWGTGVAKEATEKIVEYAFKTLNLRKVYLNVLASNVRANKFYQKNGFAFEGKFEKHVFVNGEYDDLNWYCIINEKEEIK